MGFALTRTFYGIVSYGSCTSKRYAERKVSRTYVYVYMYMYIYFLFNLRNETNHRLLDLAAHGDAEESRGRDQFLGGPFRRFGGSMKKISRCKLSAKAFDEIVAQLSRWTSINSRATELFVYTSAVALHYCALWYPIRG